MFAIYYYHKGICSQNKNTSNIRQPAGWALPGCQIMVPYTTLVYIIQKCVLQNI